VQGFFADFARIADDESRHFGWCAQRLRELGYEYGCMPAHDLLWQGARRSSGAKTVPVVPPPSVCSCVSQLALHCIAGVAFGANIGAGVEKAAMHPAAFVPSHCSCTLFTLWQLGMQHRESPCYSLYVG